MRGEQLSKKQIEKGIIILAVFVVLRAIIAKIGGVNRGVQVSSQPILFLISILDFVGMSRLSWIHKMDWHRSEAVVVV